MVDLSVLGLVVKEKRVKGVRKSIEKQTKKKSLIEFLEKNRGYLIERNRFEKRGVKANKEKGNWKLNSKGNELSFFFMCLNNKVWMSKEDVGKEYILENPTVSGYIEKLDYYISYFKNLEEDKFDNLFWIKKKVDLLDDNGNVVMRKAEKGNRIGELVKVTKYEIQKLD